MNQPPTPEREPLTPEGLPEAFREFVESAIDAKGFYPAHCFTLRAPELADGRNRLTIAALPDHRDVWPYFLREIADPEALAVVAGIDRYTKPGQGCEFADLIGGAFYLKPDKTPTTHEERAAIARVGIIEYQHEPRIVRPWNWSNALWSQAIGREILQTMATLRPDIVARSLRKATARIVERN